MSSLDAYLRLSDLSVTPEHPLERRKVFFQVFARDSDITFEVTCKID
jgi:hypothetical protein